MEIRQHALNQWVKEVTSEIRKCSEIKENENTVCHNIQDTVKAVFRVEFIAGNTFIKKEALKSTP